MPLPFSGQRRPWPTGKDRDEYAGRQYCTAVSGYSMLSGVTNTYSGFFFITLKPWEERKKPEEKYEAIMGHINREFAKLPQGVAFAFLRRPFRASAPRAA